MKITPKSESEIKRESLLPDGTYDFEVVSAEDTQSKKGNDMIALKLDVFDGDRRVHMRDWLLEAMAFKLRHFAFATGLGAKYEAGELTASDCVGRAGKVELVIKESPQYGPQNTVNDYVVPDAGTAASATKPVSLSAVAKAANADAEIPF